MSCPVTGCSIPSSSRRNLVLAAVGVAAIAGIAFYLYKGGGGEQSNGASNRSMKRKKGKKRFHKNALNGSASSGNSTDGSVLSAKGDPSPSDIEKAKQEKKDEPPK